MGKSVIILGGGKVGRAVGYYLVKSEEVDRVAIVSNRREELKECEKVVSSRKLKTLLLDVRKNISNILKKYDLVVGALPGELGLRSFILAIKSRRNLVDVSDVSFELYMKLRRKVKEKSITIIPESGLAPGLMNAIIGHEQARRLVEIKVGTLAKRKYFFPFTWCFEDLIEEHAEKVRIKAGGKVIRLKPFSGYMVERIKEVGEVETYFVDGLSTLLLTCKAKEMSCKVIRPVGFMNFFKYMKSHGFFSDRWILVDKRKIKPIEFTKNILTSGMVDNYTIMIISVDGKRWKIVSFSKKGERLNSMQKVVGVYCVFVALKLLREEINQVGLLLNEWLGEKKDYMKDVVKTLRRAGIRVVRRKCKINETHI